jgi:hypothetical protein
MVKIIEMMIAYYPHSNRAHNFKDLKLKKIQSMFQNFKILKILYDMKMKCNVHDIQTKV